MSNFAHLLYHLNHFTDPTSSLPPILFLFHVDLSHFPSLYWPQPPPTANNSPNETTPQTTVTPENPQKSHHCFQLPLNFTFFLQNPDQQCLSHLCSVTVNAPFLKVSASFLFTLLVSCQQSSSKAAWLICRSLSNMFGLELWGVALKLMVWWWETATFVITVWWPVLIGGRWFMVMGSMMKVKWGRLFEGISALTVAGRSAELFRPNYS